MSAPASPEFDRVKAQLIADEDDDVEDGPDGLTAKGALFAFETDDTRLVVDLPAARAADLVERGVAERYDGGRPARGAWVAVADTDDWLELATEAHQFVGEPAVGRDS